MIILGFQILAGAIALTSHVLSLRMANGLQAPSREARDAAESGISAVIAELNRGPNRMLASSDVESFNWEPNTSNWRLRNPCHNNGQADITNEARDIGDGQWRSLPNNRNRRYRIRWVVVKNARRTERLLTNLPAPGGAGAGSVKTGNYNPEDFELESDPLQQFSRLQITVQGQSLRNNVPLANAVVIIELGVVPKCCERSIGEPNASPGNVCSSRFPSILVGLNGGGVRQAGNNSQLREQVAGSTTLSTTKPDRIICINSSTTCGGGSPSSVDGVPIETIRRPPPSIPAYPATDNRTGATNPTNGFTIVATSADNNDNRASGSATQSLTHQDYLRVNSSGVVQLCNAKNNNFITSGSTRAGADPIMPASLVNSNSSSCDSRINNFCARTGNSSANYTYHCRISSLKVRDDSDAGTCTGKDSDCESKRIQNNSFFIDTSRGRIALHFNSPWGTSTSCGTSTATICTNDDYDDGQIQHLYCPTPPSDSNPCGQRAAPDFSSRAVIYSDRNATMSIGDDGFVRDLFTYLPKGTVILSEDPRAVDNPYGVPNYRGTLWVNDLWMGVLGINNQTMIAVPPISSTFTGMASPTPDNPFRLLPYFEWIVRGSSFRQTFGDV